MNLIITGVIIISVLIPTKKALHMFQQNRYELSRFSMWIKSSIKSNKKAIIVSLLMIIASFISAVFINKPLAIAIILLLSLKTIQKELDTTYIKPLVYTARVYRQIFVLSLLYVLVIIIAYSIGDSALIYLMLISPILAYFMIYLMHLITHPIESYVKSLFKKDAIKILEKHPNLIKVGITGSYGKTSSKNILQEIGRAHV